MDRDSFSRWRDRQYFGPRRWLENALREPWSSDGHASDSSRHSAKSIPSENACQNPAFAEHNNPVWVSDELEYWPDVKDVKFVAIAALYSELVAVGNNGAIYQWKWVEVEPYRSSEVLAVQRPFSSHYALAMLKYFTFLFRISECKHISSSCSFPGTSWGEGHLYFVIFCPVFCFDRIWKNCNVGRREDSTRGWKIRANGSIVFWDCPRTKICSTFRLQFIHVRYNSYFKNRNPSLIAVIVTFHFVQNNST
jgi:hypothetical protein